MSKYLCLILGAAALFCSSCSRSEIERLEEINATQNRQIERLNAMLGDKESLFIQTSDKLTKALADGEKAEQESSAKIKTLTDENTKLKKSLKVALENPKGVVAWFKNLPEEKRKTLEKHGVIEKYIQSEGLDCLLLVINGLDKYIEQLRLEINYYIEKFPEILSVKKDYEEAIEKMKTDGIDVDKYLKLNK